MTLEIYEEEKEIKKKNKMITIKNVKTSNVNNIIYPQSWRI